jgi:hypothetical protein
MATSDFKPRLFLPVRRRHNLLTHPHQPKNSIFDSRYVHRHASCTQVKPDEVSIMQLLIVLACAACVMAHAGLRISEQTEIDVALQMQTPEIGCSKVLPEVPEVPGVPTVPEVPPTTKPSMPEPPDGESISAEDSGLPDLSDLPKRFLPSVGPIDVSAYMGRWYNTHSSLIPLSTYLKGGEW